MNFQQFINILLARKRIIFRVFLFIVITGTVGSLLWPKSYTADTTVVVDDKNPDPVNGLLSQALVMPGYIATQVDIISSDRVARRVVKMLGFAKVPELVQNWQDESNGKGTFEGYYAALLSKKLKVEPSKESNVIDIEFTSDDPKTAAAVANAFAQAYLDTNVELMVEPAKQYADWFSERTKQVRDKMEAEQASLSAYQKEKGIVSVDERLDVENSRLNDLSAQLTILEAQKSEAESRQHQAKSSSETSPDVMINPVIQNLRETIAIAEGKLQLAANELGPNHPQIKQQRAELDELKAKLNSEIGNVAGSLTANTQVTTQKEAELRAALETQKQRVLELKKQRDEVSVLQTDLASTQLDYNNIRQRLSQSSLQSQTQQTNVAVLSPAFEPDKPSKPRILLNILVSIFLGGLIGIGVAMQMEVMDRRIRSEEDLVGLGIPVLGVLTAEQTLSRAGWWHFRWQFWHRTKAVS